MLILSKQAITSLSTLSKSRFGFYFKCYFLFTHRYSRILRSDAAELRENMPAKDRRSKSGGREMGEDTVSGHRQWKSAQNPRGTVV